MPNRSRPRGTRRLSTLRDCVTALVLAGQREGTPDPLAAATDLDYKCMVPVAGRSMILYVLEALAGSPEIGRILVSANNERALASLPEVRALVTQGRLSIVPARRNLADSVLAALDACECPVLITTADNVLLSHEAVSSFAAAARSPDVKVAVAFTRRESVLAAHPDGQRRFYRFGDGSYSNCNLYWIGHADALRATEIFRGGGQFAKHPMRIARAFGLLNLVRFRLGLGTLEGAFRRFSRRFGMTIRPVVLADGATAIDVDNARTLTVAEALLSRRQVLLAAE